MAKKTAPAARGGAPEATAPATPPLSGSPLLGLLSRHPQGVILACFFLTGATGLVYQVVWTRRLILTFGATVPAVSTVLAAFLGGLALGSLIFGRIADRRRDPVRLYAVLEGAIGLFCFATPVLFLLVEQAYVGVHPLIAEQPWALRMVRFFLAAAVILFPTILMGGTLPLLSRALVRTEGHLGTKVAGLYAINTLGAVLGAVAAGFVLIPVMGLKGSIYLAAVLNLAVAAVTYGLHVVQAFGPPPARAEADAEREPEAVPVARSFHALLIAYGLSGAAALTYEVGWTRLLSLAFGTSTYAFSAMLAAFLAGIGIGSLVPATSRRFSVDRLRAPLVWFGVVQVAIGASVTFITPVLDRLPFAFLALFQWLGPKFWALQFAELGVALVVMLLPAGLMGFAFPLVTRVATESLGVLGRRLGAVYAANTFGTVIGSFAAGFLLIPAFGVRAALGIAVAVNVLVGVSYLVSVGRRRPRLAAAGLALAAVTGLAWLVLPDWNRNVLISGAYVYPGFYLQDDARRRMEAPEILHYRDALTATISVVRAPSDLHDEPLISLQIDGKTDASTGDLSTQLLLGHLPALLHPAPRSALVVGLASGCTLGALTVYPEIERIDCVEIEPEMVPVTDFFLSINRSALDDPRVRLVIDDARNFMLVTPHRYDIITSEPSNPWISGVANLFTREYFARSRERLNPGGLFLQWIPLYNLAPADLRIIVATFHDVFPHSTMWIVPDAPTDAFLVGTLEPATFDAEQIARRGAAPTVAADLREARLKDTWDLLAGFLLDTRTIADLAHGARLNTDDFPILEFSSPRTLHTGVARETMLQALALGREARPPLAPRPHTPGETYVSGLMGLALDPPWRIVESETFHVIRRPEAFMTVAPQELAVSAAHMAAARGDLRVDIHARRLGRPAAGPFPLEPTDAPDRTVTIAGHEVAVYLMPRAPAEAPWAAFWHCPAADRAYAVVARGDVPFSADALAGLRCVH